MRSMLFVLLAAASVIPLRADAWSDAIQKLQAGDQAGAIDLLQAALAKDPGAVRPNVLLAEVLLSAQRIEEAEKVVGDALGRNPNVADLHRVSGDVKFRQGDIFGAEKEYKTAAGTDPKNARALLGVARVYQTASINSWR